MTQNQTQGTSYVRPTLITVGTVALLGIAGCGYNKIQNTLSARADAARPAAIVNGEFVPGGSDVVTEIYKGTIPCETHGPHQYTVSVVDRPGNKDGTLVQIKDALSQNGNVTRRGPNALTLYTVGNDFSFTSKVGTKSFTLARDEYITPEGKAVAYRNSDIGEKLLLVREANASKLEAVSEAAQYEAARSIDGKFDLNQPRTTGLNITNVQH